MNNSSTRTPTRKSFNTTTFTLTVLISITILVLSLSYTSLLASPKINPKVSNTIIKVNQHKIDNTTFKTNIKHAEARETPPRLISITGKKNWDARVQNRITQLKEKDDKSKPQNETIDLDETSESLSWRLNASLPECNPPPEWQTFYPTCNLIHEIDLTSSSTREESVRVLTTKGSIRIIWEVDRAKNESFILKTIYMKGEVSPINIEKNRRDSIILEKLTFSPYVINEHGFCGLSAVNERADTEVGKVFKHDESLTPLQRLKMVRDLAIGLKHMHDVSGVKVSHNDINPGNILVKNGIVKYHDFNLAAVLPFDQTRNKTCEFPITHFGSPQWRAPEEMQGLTSETQIGVTVTEKIDVYSLGNIMYMALHGEKPWDGNKISKERKFELKRNGALPVHPKDSSKGEHLALTVIRNIMKICYTFDVDDRPSASAIANTLKEIVKLMESGAVSSVRDLQNKIPMLIEETD